MGIPRTGDSSRSTFATLKAEPSASHELELGARDRAFSSFGYTNKTGALLMPHVSAQALHDLLEAVEPEVLSDDPELSRFVPERAPSSWIHVDGEWWPKIED